jgi:parallel beta-helix repeat protein
MSRFMPTGMLLCLALFCASQSRAATLNVPAGYAKIQDAINAANNGDTVVVAQGTYVENTDFKGKAITVTSTNPLDATVVAATNIQGGNSGPVVSFKTGEGSASVIEGFTIARGHASEGDVYCSGSSPTISHNVITSGWPRGIYCSHGSPLISDCTVSGSYGFGISAHDATPTIQRCTVSGNADGGIGGGWRRLHHPRLRFHG